MYVCMYKWGKLLIAVNYGNQALRNCRRIKSEVTTQKNAHTNRNNKGTAGFIYLGITSRSNKGALLCSYLLLVLLQLLLLLAAQTITITITIALRQRVIITIN